MRQLSHVGPVQWPAEAVIPVARTLPALLDQIAEDSPDAPAVLYAGRTTTYAELAAAVERSASTLSGLGVGAGTRVALLATNSTEWLVTAFAIMRLGARLDAFNTWSRAYDLEHLLGASTAEVLLVTPDVGGHDMLEELRPLVPELWTDKSGNWRNDRYPALRAVVALDDRTGLPQGVLAWPRLLADAPSVTVADASRAEDAAMVLYTSGSTRHPKAVPLVHRDLVLNAFAIGERMGLSATDRVWLGSPLFWSFGIANAVVNTMTHGACLVLQERFSPHATADLLVDGDCTAAYLLPSMIDALASTVPDRVRCQARLRTGVMIGRADEFNRATEQLGIMQICNVYGSTETYGNCCVTEHTMPDQQRSECQGRPLPGVELRILGKAGNLLPIGEAGEIQVRGRVTSGYLGDSESSAAALTDDGWFRTGDTGLLLEDGSVRFVARHSEMIKTSGINVSPTEVETFVSRLPAVEEVTVVGAPHPTKGEVVVAFVRSNDPDLSAQEVIDFCRGSIAGYMVPHTVILVDELPKTGTGKLRRKDLVQEAVTRLNELAGRETAGTA